MGRKLPKEAGGLGEKLFAHSLQTWRTAAWAGGSGETCNASFRDQNKNFFVSVVKLANI